MGDRMNLPARYVAATGTLLSGGFGSVQRVRDTFLERDVIVKRMHDPEQNEQLVTEIQVLSQIRSRHVVDIYDVIYDEQGKVHGIVIELLSGPDGIDLSAEARIDQASFIRILYQVACGLSDLHAAGVVHRDLKLNNLKQADSGLIKLFDFGISSSDVAYRTRANRGTLVYAAPELYEHYTLIRPEIDIYAFGICAWQLLTDKLPPQLYERPPQQSGPVATIATAGPTLPDDIVELLDSCLSPNLSLRPSACKVRDLLKAHLVRWQHKGLFVEGASAVYELSQSSKGVRLRYPGLGELRAIYDGLSFQVEVLDGDVYINNRAVVQGERLHEACLLTFGSPDLGNLRRYVSFFSSHPEVII